MLEQVRRKLRLLVPLIERTRKDVVDTDLVQFRKKAEYFLKQHLADAAVAS